VDILSKTARADSPRGEDAGRVSRTAWLLGNLIVLAVLGAVLFPAYDQRLFNGLDGHYMLSLARQQWEWMGVGFSFTSSPLHGLGNIFFPTNMPLVPVYAGQMMVLGKIDPVVSYIGFAVEMFLAGYILSRALCLGPAIAITASWVLVLLALPLLPRSFINAGYQLSPHIVDLLLMYAGFVLLITRPDAWAWGWRWVRAIGLILLPLAMAMQNPLVFVIFVPAAGCFYFSALIRAEWRERGLLLSTGLATLVAAYLSGLISFLAANTFYTATSFFSDEFVSLQSALSNVSLAFQGPAYTFGLYLVVGGLAGALLTVIFRRGPTRWFAATFIVIAGLTIGVGFLGVSDVFAWRGPQAQYFEYALWPGYAAYTIQIGAIPWGKVAAWIPVPKRLGAGLCTVLPPLIAYAWFTQSPAPAGDAFYPPRSSPIVERLREEIAVTPGKTFAGYAATFAGMVARDGPIDWVVQHGFDHKESIRGWGGDHRLVGFWWFDVPTLNDYSQYTSPTLYLIASRLLARPDDGQFRNVITYSYANAALLQAMGVRYLVADDSVSLAAPELLALDLPSQGQLRLLELPDPNLASYTPNEVLRLSAAETLERMADGVDYRRTVFVSPDAGIKDPNGRLVLSALSFREGGYRLRTQASGTVLVLLPLQFSHCFTTGPLAGEDADEGTGDGAIRLVRANIWQLAAVVSGEVDVSLQFRSGPGSAACRQRDLADMADIDIKGAASRVPIGAGS
jgi:hypothetical protein